MKVLQSGDYVLCKKKRCSMCNTLLQITSSKQLSIESGVAYMVCPICKTRVETELPAKYRSEILQRRSTFDVLPPAIAERAWWDKTVLCGNCTAKIKIQLEDVLGLVDGAPSPTAIHRPLNCYECGSMLDMTQKSLE